MGEFLRADTAELQRKTRADTERKKEIDRGQGEKEKEGKRKP